MHIEFKFDLEQKVITQLGEPGIIQTLAVDDSGITYYVQTRYCGAWFKELQLRDAT